MALFLFPQQLLLMFLYTFYVFDTFVNATCFYANAPGRNISKLVVLGGGGENSSNNTSVIISPRGNDTKEKVTFGSFNPSRGPRPWQSFSEYFKANEMVCEPTLRTMIIAYLFAGYAIIGVLYELYKMCESWFDYWRTPLNLGWWILAGNMAITALPGLGIYGHSWLYPYAAFSLVYGWILVLAQVGRIPYFGIFVGIFTEVLKDFCLLLLTFSPILLAFALGFSVLLPQNEFFRSIPTALFKVFLMMTGDVDFWGIFRETWAVVSITEKRGFVYIPLFFIYSSFILMVVMVLMSLLLGLAVNDIQEIRREAALKRTVRLTQEIGIFESMLQIPMFFHCGCSEYFMRLFSITSLDYMNGPELITFPDDPEDLTLPSEIKQKLVPYLNRGCCSHYNHHDRRSRKGRKWSFPMSNKEQTSRPEGSSEKVIIPQDNAGENKSGRFMSRQLTITENVDPDVEKGRQVLYRDLSLYHEVRMLLNSNEEMKRHLEALKSKLIGKD
ncbi:Transient receptor potential cation channel subfamily A member 1 [Orchesella cincta]|uniref:Transient receptor potential cation channel subfamily A member 1 n=1 Tax=Orchesella cincta TaxID=48709 RepID=A0A1D2NM32_ORCCI|nr:Transient receptor potential cation channel subfamily A member 1 [Orchesella cincta]